MRREASVAELFPARLTFDTKGKVNLYVSMSCAGKNKAPIDRRLRSDALLDKGLTFHAVGLANELTLNFATDGFREFVNKLYNARILVRGSGALDVVLQLLDQII